MIITARLKAKEGKGDRLKELLSDMVGKVATEPGAIAYTIHRSASDPAVFFIYEKYTDGQAFTFHAKSEHFKALSASLGDVLDGPADIQAWEEVAAIKR